VLITITVRDNSMPSTPGARPTSASGCSLRRPLQAKASKARQAQSRVKMLERMKPVTPW